MNGVFDVYKAMITVNTPIINGDVMNITFPSDIGFPSSSVNCTAVDNLVNVTC